MLHSLWHVPLCRDCVWCPLSLLQEPEFPLVTPQLLDDVMPAVVPHVPVKQPYTQLLIHMKRTLWRVKEASLECHNVLGFITLLCQCMNRLSQGPAEVPSACVVMTSSLYWAFTLWQTLYISLLQASQLAILQVRERKCKCLPKVTSYQEEEPEIKSSVHNPQSLGFKILS